MWELRSSSIIQEEKVGEALVSSLAHLMDILWLVWEWENPFNTIQSRYAAEAFLMVRVPSFP